MDTKKRIQEEIKDDLRNILSHEPEGKMTEKTTLQQTLIFMRRILKENQQLRDGLERCESSLHILMSWKMSSHKLSPEDFQIQGVKVMRMISEIVAGTRDADKALEEIVGWKEEMGEIL